MTPESVLAANDLVDVFAHARQPPLDGCHLINKITPSLTSRILTRPASPTTCYLERSNKVGAIKIAGSQMGSQ